MALSLVDTGAVYQDPTGSNDFTDISGFSWVKVASATNAQRIFMNGHSGGFGQGFHFYSHTDGSLRIDIEFVATLTSSLVIDTGWHFVGFQRRASDGVWVVYLDDETPDEIGDNGPFSNDTNAGMVVGGRMINGTITPDYNGLIYFTGFWDKLLSAGEIEDLFDGTSTPADLTTNLLVDLLYPSGDLGDNSAGSLGDFSLNGTTTFSSESPFSAGSPAPAAGSTVALMGVGR